MVNKILLHRIVLCALFILSFIGLTSAQQISLSQQEINWIGEKIFENECASKDEGLVQWNEGEDFLSLGIGHFIWYPKGQGSHFEESFSEFLVFAKTSGVKIPNWLNTTSTSACPWDSRNDFLHNQEDSRLLELQGFLIAMKSLQAEFIIKRLNDNLAIMLQNVPEKDSKRISRHTERLASTPQGKYVLADYSDFKGFGILPSEQYRGKGWGLLQVLSEMRDEKEAPDVIKEFVETANRILVERVNNSPSERNEQKWLPGWQKRLNTYLK